jgi:hypothetical protein
VTSLFEYSDVALAGMTPEVLGLWQTVPLSASSAMSFNPTSVTPLEVPLWRVNLPADHDLSATKLALGETRLDASRQGLAAVPDRLHRIGALAKARPAGLAFGISAAAKNLAQPEVELLTFLDEIQGNGAPVSYGFRETLTAGWEEATQNFEALVKQLVQFIAHYAWVESLVDGQLLGRTVVSWTGDVKTAWQAGVLPAQAALHQRALALALASRNNLIRTFVMAADAAVKLSLLSAMPGGAVLALPAAWKFINHVLAEVAAASRMPRCG